jgi:NAD+ kinase
MTMREITVFTHRRPHDVQDAFAELLAQAREAGVTLRLDPEETAKLDLRPEPGLALDAEVRADVELCVVLGGDGTILRALQHYVGTDVPVFGINFGEIGFLATVEPENLVAGVTRALERDYELLRLPAITLELGDGSFSAINDIAIHRKVGERVAELAYSLDSEEAGSVRCDGLVVATPAGSTGYNLANGGPVMAWGVEGYVVSFIAPHSMSARALVAAPDDRLTIRNLSMEPLDVAVDGRPVGEIPAGGSIQARFTKHLGTLAQLPGSSFYRRLREKFGRLAS